MMGEHHVLSLITRTVNLLTYIFGYTGRKEHVLEKEKRSRGSERS